MDWFDVEEAEEMESWCAVGEMMMEDYEHDKEIYNQALEDIFNLAKQNAYDDGVDYSIGLQKLDELISNISK